MFIPRYSTLAEELYQNIEDNEYLRKIYSNLLYNYSLQIFNRNGARKAINLRDALRFSDILSKSINLPNSDKHRILGQELAILLKILYSDDAAVNQYLFSVLSSVGNYRGLQTSSVESYKSVDALDGIFHEYEKEMLRIPGTEDTYFFHDQKSVYDSLKYRYFRQHRTVAKR